MDSLIEWSPAYAKLPQTYCMEAVQTALNPFVINSSVFEFA